MNCHPQITVIKTTRFSIPVYSVKKIYKRLYPNTVNINKKIEISVRKRVKKPPKNKKQVKRNKETRYEKKN